MGFISWWKGEPAPVKPVKPPPAGLFGNFLEMPFFLKFLALGNLMSGVISFIFLSPYGSPTIDGKRIPYDSLWSSGVMYFFIFSGCALLLNFYAILHRERFARELWLGIWFFFLLGQGFYESPNWFDWILNMSMYLGLWGLYLFKRKLVIEYFSKTA